MKLKSKETQKSRKSGYGVRDERGVVTFPIMLDALASNFGSVINSDPRNMSSSSRIGFGGVRGFDFEGAALHSTKVTGMDSSMLRSRGTNGSPASDRAMLRIDSKNELSLKIIHIAPIKNDGGEGILDSDSEISKENAWSLNTSENREAQENHYCGESNIGASGVIAICKCGVEHASTEDVTEHGVNHSSSSAEDFRVTTVLKKSSIGVLAHE